MLSFFQYAWYIGFAWSCPMFQHSPSWVRQCWELLFSASGSGFEIVFKKQKKLFLCMLRFYLRLCRTWTKGYLVISQTRVKRFSRKLHRTNLKRVRPRIACSSYFLSFSVRIWDFINPLTASGRIYPSKWHQGHGHQKESLHRYFWMDVHNQGIVGKVLFCSKRGCLYFWNRFRNDDVARLRSLNSARCPRSVAITAAAALNSGAGCCRGNS